MKKVVRVSVMIMGIVFIFASSLIITLAQGIIEFNDSNFESEVRDAINKPTGEISKSDVNSIEWLDVPSSEITDIEGIRNFINLKHLNLKNNKIRDLAPLKGLMLLNELYLDDNNIETLDQLSGLSRLETLSLDENNVEKINPLEHLTALKYLYLSYNNVSDLSPLKNLTKLETLSLDDNDISQISPLSNLTNLRVMHLANNNISDISPLRDLTSLQRLFLAGNPINDFTPLAEYYENLIETDFTIDNPVIRVTGVYLNDKNIELEVGMEEELIVTVGPLNVANKNVSWKSDSPNIAKVDSDGKVIAVSEGISEITVITEDGGYTASCSVIVNQPKVPATGVNLNKEQLELDVGDTETLIATVLPSDATNPMVIWRSSSPDIAIVDGKGKVTAKGEGTSKITVMTKDGRHPAICRVTVVEKITFQDPNLDRLIRDLINKPNGAIFKSDVEEITSLNGPYMNISNLEGIQYLTNLTNLNLNNNDINDITLLSDLINLRTLQLDRNSISDISSLENLTYLGRLHLIDNAISDIKPLENLTELETACIEGNKISDLKPLSNLTNLRELYLLNNDISDINPVSNLLALEDLNLIENEISDIKPLGNLINLRNLYLSNNEIGVINPLSNLLALEDLSLDENNIGDISPLSNLVELRKLHLSNNEIKDISPLNNLLELEALSLDKNTIDDIRPLGNLNKLKELLLDENHIKNYSPVHDYYENLEKKDFTIVGDVTLNREELKLEIGETEQLKATVMPEDATNKNVSWESNSPTVANVDSDGKVRTLRVGEAEITVITEDGEYTDRCSVSVSPRVIEVTGVELDIEILELKWPVRRTAQLVATVLPENATNKNVKWTSNSNIITVDENGKVTIHKEGTGTITATTEDGEILASCTVNATWALWFLILVSSIVIIIIVVGLIRSEIPRTASMSLIGTLILVAWYIINKLVK